MMATITPAQAREIAERKHDPQQVAAALYSLANQLEEKDAEARLWASDREKLNKRVAKAEAERDALKMTEAQIKHMVNRFLGWRLPEDFRPDGGVEFDADAAKKLDPRNLRYTPYGTNLLDARQAEAMVRHMLTGLPDEDSVGAAKREVGAPQ